ncbi:MAG: SLC13 family permease [Deltaproteobacteria bacterium]|nr:SLC13 family permease [Deltaproteobacteria bacterium]
MMLSERVWLETFFLLGVLLLWVVQPIPLYLTSLSILLITSIFGILSFNDVVDTIFDPVIFLFVGVFAFVNVLQRHLIIERVICKFLPEKNFASEKSIFITSALAFFLSSFVSNTAVTCYFLPFTPTLIRLGCKNLTKRFLLTISIFSNLGGLLTPVGTPPNAITIANLKQQGIEITFFGWFSKAFPVALTTAILGYLMLMILFPTEQEVRQGRTSQNLCKNPTNHNSEPWTLKDLILILSCIVCIFLWLLSGVFSLPVWFPVWLVLLFLVVFRFQGERLAEIDIFLKMRWDLILFLIGGLLVGKFIENSVLLTLIKDSNLLRESSFAVLAVTVITSNFVSNTATASILTPIFSQVDPDVSVAVGLACSFGFILPISTATNTLIYATGLLALRDMVFVGSLLDFFGIFMIWLIAT